MKKLNKIISFDILILTRLTFEYCNKIHIDTNLITLENAKEVIHQRERSII